MGERVLVLRDPEGYRERNLECLDAGGSIGTEIGLDGVSRGYRELNGARVSTDDEWVEVDADEVDAHYAALDPRG